MKNKYSDGQRVRSVTLVVIGLVVAAVVVSIVKGLTQIYYIVTQ
jgi:hypothetical protein